MTSNLLSSQYIDCRIPDSKLLIQAKTAHRIHQANGVNIVFNLDTLEHNYSAGGEIAIEFSLSDKQLLTLQKTIKEYLNKKEIIENVVYH